MDEIYMLEAINQAKLALEEGEIPVGCVIIHENKIIARGFNQTNRTRNGTRLAQFNCSKQANV